MWPTAFVVGARDPERDFLHFTRRHSAAAPAKRPASEEHRVRLFQPLARCRRVRPNQPSSCHSRPGACWSRRLTTATVLDSQSVKIIEDGGPCGYDAGKKSLSPAKAGMKGRKRRVMVDTDGRALVLQAQPANMQDRDGAVPVLKLSPRALWFGAYRSDSFAQHCAQIS